MAYDFIQCVEFDKSTEDIIISRQLQGGIKALYTMIPVKNDKGEYREEKDIVEALGFSLLVGCEEGRGLMEKIEMQSRRNGKR